MPKVEKENKKISIIEDDKFLLELISRKLKRYGFSVSKAENGLEAFDLVVQNMPDVILLDIILPGMNGFEILKKIKDDERTKKIPVILFSNLGQSSDFDKGKELGATSFIIKASVTPSQIVHQIEKVIDGKNDYSL